jgi:hypothetical protein
MVGVSGQELTRPDVLGTRLLTGSIKGFQRRPNIIYGYNT